MFVDGGRTQLQILKARPMEQGLEGEGCGIWERGENGGAGSEAGECGGRWQGELFVIHSWPAPVVPGKAASMAEPYGWGTGTHKMAAELTLKTGYFWQYQYPCFSPVRLGKLEVNLFHMLMLEMSGGCNFINVMLTQGYCESFMRNAYYSIIGKIKKFPLPIVFYAK